jgi:hypothetical protein
MLTNREFYVGNANKSVSSNPFPLVYENMKCEQKTPTTPAKKPTSTNDERATSI